MARAAIPTKVQLADPLRPKLENWNPPYSGEFVYWANLLANLWGLRGLYLARAHDYKIQRFDQVIQAIQKEGRRTLPQHRAEIQSRAPYLVEDILAEPGTDLSQAQELGWWIGALVSAFDLARTYGIVLGANDRLALSTANIWKDVSALAYRCVPDDLVASLVHQVTGGRCETPENAWELVMERLAENARS